MNALKFTLIACVVALFSCAKSEIDTNTLFNGKLSKIEVAQLKGFPDDRAQILANVNVPLSDFKIWSIDSVWHLSADNQKLLKDVRQAISRPSTTTLIQKFIPLEDVATYMNNVYGGTVGGFITVSADVKRLSSLFDVYWGLRLDYEGTKFKEKGAGYAVIRFYSDAAATLDIPFCQEMGGTQPHAWPNSGGGFTASTLGDGGFPEYTFPAYSAPKDGAELYEVTPEGREILRSIYVKDKGWQTHELGATAIISSADVKIRNGIFSDTRSGQKTFVITNALYHGNEYIIRGQVGDNYHLTTTTPYKNVELEVVDKGIYGIVVPVEAVDKVWEQVSNI